MLTDGPDQDTIEVNLFGPGAGESALVHLGDDRWMIVDSCSEVRGGTPAPLEYLYRIGRDPAAAVDYVVATHWHDDHVHGLNAVVRACAKAAVWLTNAINVQDLNTLFQLPEDDRREGTRELGAVLETLRGTGTIKKPDRRYLLALERTPLVHPARHPKGWDGAITCLAPSSQDLPYALRGVRNLTGSGQNQAGAVTAPNKNHASVVLHVRLGQQALLLAGDRVKTSDTGRGWHVVVSNHRDLQLSRVNVVKVAHHGDPNGNDDRIWTELAAPDVWAIVAPFYRGVGGGRPRTEDVQRLLADASEAFITSTKRPSSGVSTAPVDFTDVDAAGRPLIQPVDPPMGHVRLRAQRSGGAWSVESPSPAGHLREMLTATA